jgi:hypothetical protein
LIKKMEKYTPGLQYVFGQNESTTTGNTLRTDIPYGVQGLKIGSK